MSQEDLKLHIKTLGHQVNATKSELERGQLLYDTAIHNAKLNAQQAYALEQQLANTPTPIYDPNNLQAYSEANKKYNQASYERDRLRREQQNWLAESQRLDHIGRIGLAQLEREQQAIVVAKKQLDIMILEKEFRISEELKDKIQVKKQEIDALRQRFDYRNHELAALHEQIRVIETDRQLVHAMITKADQELHTIGEKYKEALATFHKHQEEFNVQGQIVQDQNVQDQNVQGQIVQGQNVYEVNTKMEVVDQDDGKEDLESSTGKAEYQLDDDEEQQYQGRIVKKTKRTSKVAKKSKAKRSKKASKRMSKAKRSKYASKRTSTKKH